jgi:hypothetical protein
MDPHRVLGVAPGASLAEVTAAYRGLAKRWHPDRHRSSEEAGAAQRRMAEINAAYELLRSEQWLVEQRRAAGARTPDSAPPAGARRKLRKAADWLPEATRRALGPELLSALQQDEKVELVTPAAAWASPEALLAVTDRRLLWLLDDAVTGRVRTLEFPAITGLDVKLSWPRRRTAVLRVSRRNGKRPITFGELRPETARAIAGLVGERAAA